MMTVAFNPMTVVPLKRGKLGHRDTDTHKKQHHMNTHRHKENTIVAEIEVTHPQPKNSKDCWPDRGKKISSPSERAWPCQHFYLELLSSRTVMLFVLAPSVCGTLLWSLRVLM